MTEIKSKIKAFIGENFSFDDVSALEDDSSFLNAGIIDSTGILELVEFLEEEFSIKVQDDELIPENLDSLNKVAAYLNSKLQ